jgi:hypothetical protein
MVIFTTPSPYTSTGDPALDWFPDRSCLSQCWSSWGRHRCSTASARATTRDTGVWCHTRVYPILLHPSQICGFDSLNSMCVDRLEPCISSNMLWFQIKFGKVCLPLCVVVPCKPNCRRKPSSIVYLNLNPWYCWKQGFSLHICFTVLSPLYVGGTVLPDSEGCTSLSSSCMAVVNTPGGI